MSMHVDEIDKQILNILIKNGRTSYADIAKEVGMKSPSVIERIKKLEYLGILKGYTAIVNYKALGYDILAFIGVNIDNAQHIEDFEREMHNLDSDIVECHHVTGESTMRIKVITRNTESLSQLIKKIRSLIGVRSTSTILVLSSILDGKRSV